MRLQPVLCANKEVPERSVFKNPFIQSFTELLKTRILTAAFKEQDIDDEAVDDQLRLPVLLIYLKH